MATQPDPFDVYYFAVAYNKSAARLEEQAQQAPYGISIVMLQTLSVEVFLKCIHRLRDCKIPPHHNLSELYKSLPDDDQLTLSEMFLAVAQSRGGNPENLSLADVLSRSKRLFEAIRYAYEEDHPGMPTDSHIVPVNLGLNSTILAIRDFIKRERPDFGPLAEARHTQ